MLKDILFILFVIALVIFIVIFAPLILQGSFRGQTLRDGGVFISRDNGDNWIQKKNLLPKGDISRVEVIDIAIDPTDSNLIFLGTKEGGLYKSLDAGESWFAFRDLIGFLGPRDTVEKIAYDKTNKDRFYLAIFQARRGKLLKTVDNGQSFREVFTVASDNFLIYDIVVDPQKPSRLYLATGQGGFITSDDYGESWRVLKWFPGPVWQIIINPFDSNVIYAVTRNQGLFKTQDRGKSWTELSLEIAEKFPGSLAVMDMAMNPNNSNILYLATSFGLLKSSNAGLTFEAVKSLVIPPESLPVLSVDLSPLNNNLIFLSAANHIYRSEDNGKNWIIATPATSKKIRVLKIDPKNPKIILAGMENPQ
ncbi:MAG: hypothetical protein HYV52_03100 [Parcubacteria group bacterium]|nr:hypothetical protein [Parcubacteria group bacterium]